MQHEMHLNQKDYEQVVRGQKTLEIRINDEKRRLIRVLDTIRFENRANPSQFINVRVDKLITAANFKELFTLVDPFKAGWSKNVSAEKAARDMKKYYTNDSETKNGVVAIKIFLT